MHSIFSVLFQDNNASPHTSALFMNAKNMKIERSSTLESKVLHYTPKERGIMRMYYKKNEEQLKMSQAFAHIR